MRLPINIMWVFSNIHLFIHAFTPVCQLLYTFIQSPDSCVCAQSFTHVRPFVTLWTVVHQAPLSMRLSQQEYWNGFNWCLLWRKTLGEVKLSLSLLFSSVQSLSRLQFIATPWITARQASLSITNSQSSPKLMCIESVMPSSHLILCRPLFFLPPIPPSIRVFSNESTLRMRWPKYWSFSFNISPSTEHPGLISFRMDWLDLLAVQGSSPIPQFKSINSSALSFLHSPTLTSIHDHWKNHSLD